MVSAKVGNWLPGSGEDEAQGLSLLGWALVRAEQREWRSGWWRVAGFLCYELCALWFTAHWRRPSFAVLACAQTPPRTWRTCRAPTALVSHCACTGQLWGMHWSLAQDACSCRCIAGGFNSVTGALLCRPALPPPCRPPGPGH